MLRSVAKRRLLLLALLTALAAQSSRPLPFDAWHRASDKPVIAPRGSGWESAGTFNPAVVRYGGEDRDALPRTGTSKARRAWDTKSNDGLPFHARDGTGLG